MATKPRQLLLSPRKGAPYKIEKLLDEIKIRYYPDGNSIFVKNITLVSLDKNGEPKEKEMRKVVNRANQANVDAVVTVDNPKAYTFLRENLKEEIKIIQL